MSSDLSFVEFILEQLKNVGLVTHKKMFGEYAVYLDGKITALICDNQLFIKPTVAGRAFIGDVTEAPPYPGAKNSFLIDNNLEDGEWLSNLMRLTAAELPQPKPKAVKKIKTKKSKS